MSKKEVTIHSIFAVLVWAILFFGFIAAAQRYSEAQKEVAALQDVIAYLQENPYVLVIEEEAQTADLGEQTVSAEDVDLLARLIYCEIGSDGHPDTQLYCVGSVVLNRIADDRFPDTLRGVIYQSSPCWQYAPARDGTIETAKPTARCYEIAEDLLRNGSRLPPAVVWQSGTKQGRVFATFESDVVGTTTYYGEIGG